MECSVIVLECSYIMDLMVFQAHFNIYYRIIVVAAWCGDGFAANDIVFILGFLDSYEFAPYRHTLNVINSFSGLICYVSAWFRYVRV